MCSSQLPVRRSILPDAPHACRSGHPIARPPPARTSQQVATRFGLPPSDTLEFLLGPPGANRASRGQSPIAQLAEQPTVNRQVSGSSPDGGAVTRANVSVRPWFCPFRGSNDTETTRLHPARRPQGCGEVGCFGRLIDVVAFGDGVVGVAELLGGGLGAVLVGDEGCDGLADRGRVAPAVVEIARSGRPGCAGMHGCGVTARVAND